jgi:hypothetical protein
MVGPVLVSYFAPVFLHLLKCSSAHAVLYLVIYYVVVVVIVIIFVVVTVVAAAAAAAVVVNRFRFISLIFLWSLCVCVCIVTYCGFVCVLNLFFILRLLVDLLHYECVS